MMDSGGESVYTSARLTPDLPSQGSFVLDLSFETGMKWAPTDVPADTQPFEAWSKTLPLRDLWFPYSPKRYCLEWSTRAGLDTALDAFQRFPFTLVILRDVDHDEPQASLLIAYFIDRLNIPTMRTLDIRTRKFPASIPVVAALGGYLASARSHGLRHLTINGEGIALELRSSLIPIIKANYTLRTLEIMPDSPPMGLPAAPHVRLKARWMENGYGYTPIYHDIDRELLRNGKIAECVWKAALRGLGPARAILRGRKPTAGKAGPVAGRADKETPTVTVTTAETVPDTVTTAVAGTATETDKETAGPAQLPPSASPRPPGALGRRLSYRLSSFWRTAPPVEPQPQSTRPTEPPLPRRLSSTITSFVAPPAESSSAPQASTSTSKPSTGLSRRLSATILAAAAEDKVSAPPAKPPARPANPSTARSLFSFLLPQPKARRRSSRKLSILDLPYEVQFEILVQASDHPAQLSPRQWHRLFEHASNPEALKCLVAQLGEYVDEERSWRSGMKEWFDAGGIWYEE